MGVGGNLGREATMPWKSAQQQKWGHSPSGLKALGGKSAVGEWDAASKGKQLPERVGPPKPAPKAAVKRKSLFAKA